MLPERLQHLKPVLHQFKFNPTITLPHALSRASALAIPTSIYVISCNEFIKLGKAKNVLARLGDLQVSNPYKLRLIGSWIATNAQREESTLHSYYKASRIRGEWFRLPSNIMTIISIKMSPFDLASALLPPDFLPTNRDRLLELNQRF